MPEPVRPLCPVCRTEDTHEPDPLGVHRCRACCIEFRPPRRVPIRRVESSSPPTTTGALDNKAWLGIALVVVLIGVGLGLRDGSRQRAYTPPSFEVPNLEIPELQPFELPSLPPELAPVNLDTEIHADEPVPGHLYTTGLVHNRSERDATLVGVSAALLGHDGTQLQRVQAVVGCTRLRVHESCAWALDIDTPADFVACEVSASGAPSLVEVFSPFSRQAHFDAAGRSDGPNDGLELDVDDRRVTFSIDGTAMATDVRATVTAFDENQQVIDVLETRWPSEPMVPGKHTLTLALPQRSFEHLLVRIEGVSMEIPGEAY